VLPYRRTKDMDIAEAMRRVEAIDAMSGDPERAHGAEDELYLEFVRLVAESDHPLARVASVIVKTQELGFSRWCA
jgi:hypothetical protein